MNRKVAQIFSLSGIIYLEKQRGKPMLNRSGNVAVIYKSKYGSTKRYARWIAEEVHADLYDASDVEAEELL